MEHIRHRVIKVTAESDSNAEDGIKWKFSKGLFGKNLLIFENDNEGDYFLVTFKLKDETSPPRNLKFVQDPHEALWVDPYIGPSQGCPTQKNSAVTVIKPLYVDPSREELTVANENKKDEKFYFMLRFDAANPTKTVRYDPIWDNKNGHDRSIAVVAAVIVGGVVVVAAATKLLRLW